MKEDVVVGHDDFSRNLAKELDAQYVNIKLHVFPDNEIKPTLQIRSEDELKYKEVLLVSRTNRFDPRPNDAIIELGLNVRNLKDLGTNNVDIVMPYMFYARQDESFQTGEPRSFQHIEKLYQRWLQEDPPSDALMVDRIFTINSHQYGKSEPLQLFFEGINIYDWSPSKLFAEHFKAKKLKEPLVVVPGPEKLAKELSEQIDADYEALAKERDHRTGKIALAKSKTSFKDRDVIVYDDVTSTGGTVKAAVDFVNETDPHRVYVALTHLIGRNGTENVCDLKIDEVVTTDSLESGKEYKPFVELSTVPLLSEYIRKL